MTISTKSRTFPFISTYNFAACTDYQKYQQVVVQNAKDSARLMQTDMQIHFGSQVVVEFSNFRAAAERLERQTFVYLVYNVAIDGTGQPGLDGRTEMVTRFEFSPKAKCLPIGGGFNLQPVN